MCDSLLTVVGLQSSKLNEVAAIYSGPLSGDRRALHQPRFLKKLSYSTPSIRILTGGSLSELNFKHIHWIA